MMDFYKINLAVFVVLNACLLFRQHRARETKLRHDNLVHGCNDRSETRASNFQFRVLSVYCLAVAADWLQGPYTYAVYKYEKKIPENYVALLYAIGFIFGGTSAHYVGQLADRLGRRRMCLAYCACYAATCLSMLSDNFTVLCLGRVFGGHATTILFTVFETWMISDYHALQFDEITLPLSDVFGNMTMMSGIMAIGSGMMGDGLVRYFCSRIWPFYASLACCVMAAALIMLLWDENYGTRATKADSVWQLYRTALRDPNVVILGCTMLSFEGTMYLFVFFWSATLKSARSKSGTQEDLPFGIVFSSFMCAMMAGSAILSVSKKSCSTESAKAMLMLVFAFTIASLAIVTLADHEYIMFYGFCVIEACVGVYFPSMAFIKSEVIGDSKRGSIYSLLRLPLNCFVVAVHAFDREGDEHRNGVFLLCSSMLIFTLWIVKDAQFERLNI